MSSVAVITARGGSKRIPRKNIKLFHGKPIIAYSIETALRSGVFDMVMVSTDDEEIAAVSKQYGAEVPFYRNSKTSDDHAVTADVMMEVITELKNIGKEFDHACCIYPTAPLISEKDLSAAFELLKEKNYISVFPVSEFSYPIWRSLKVDENGKVEMNWPENINTRSQDLPKAYHDAGQFYWMRIEAFMADKKIFTSNSGVIKLSELQVQDIDNETDWSLAEIKYTLLRSTGE